jgi:class 3 adenylate cyclase
VSYELVQLLPRLTSLWIPPLLVAFFAALYPQESSLHVVRWSLLFALLYSPVLWLVPLPFMLETPTYLYLIGGLVMIGYASSVLLQATRARRPYARLLWLSFVPVTFTATLEILAQWGVVPFTHWTPWALLCGIGGQTLVLSHRFTQAFTAVEILAEHLNRTNQAYYRFVPREFLRLLGRNDITAIELGDQSQQEMTVLFADVRGFTSLSEQMTPRENFAFINTLMGGISPLIREHHGFIDKYIGDGIMALFPRCPEDALQAAVAMRQRLNTFNAARESQGHHPIRLGIGIHVGSLMLGTVGEPQRMDGTVIADVVNAASRLESLTKRYGVMLIVSEQVWRALDHAEQYSARRLGVVRAKGKRDPITLYEVFEGDATDGAQLKRQTRAEFETGLRHFKDGEFALAQQAFAQVLSAHPQDPAALYYHKQSEFYSTHAPPPDWDGIEVSTEK